MLIYLSHTGRPRPFSPWKLKMWAFIFFLMYAYELRAFYKCKSYFFLFILLKYNKIKIFLFLLKTICVLLKGVACVRRKNVESENRERGALNF